MNEWGKFSVFFGDFFFEFFSIGYIDWSGWDGFVFLVVELLGGLGCGRRFVRVCVRILLVF